MTEHDNEECYLTSMLDLYPGVMKCMIGGLPGMDEINSVCVVQMRASEDHVILLGSRLRLVSCLLPSTRLDWS